MDIADIRLAIESEPALQALLPNTQAIAVELSTRDTHKVPFEIGVGLLLETIGLESGNALLDAIKTTPDFRHVYLLLEQGRLDLSSPLVEIALGMLVQAEVISNSDMQILLSICIKPVDVPESDVKQAIWHDDGSLAINLGGE